MANIEAALTSEGGVEGLTRGARMVFESRLETQLAGMAGGVKYEDWVRWISGEDRREGDWGGKDGERRCVVFGECCGLVWVR